MSGLNLFEKIYFINACYTIFLFFFYHSFLVEHLMEATGRSAEEILDGMWVIYILILVFGSLFLLLDLLQLIFDHKNCLWLKPLYRKKE